MYVLRRDLSGNAAMVVLRIYNKESGPWGELFNIYEQQAIVCQNTGDFLLKLDALYDRLSFPQATLKKRSFSALPNQPYRQNIIYKPAHSADAFRTYALFDKQSTEGTESFYIHTLFRQHASWQGTVVWANQQQACQYRSALGLLELIDSALHLHKMEEL